MALEAGMLGRHVARRGSALVLAVQVRTCVHQHLYVYVCVCV